MTELARTLTGNRQRQGQRHVTPTRQASATTNKKKKKKAPISFDASEQLRAAESDRPHARPHARTGILSSARVRLIHGLHITDSRLTTARPTTASHPPPRPALPRPPTCACVRPPARRRSPGPRHSKSTGREFSRLRTAHQSPRTTVRARAANTYPT